MARAADTQVLIDTTTTADFIYIGTATRSTLTNNPSWKIVGIDTTTISIRSPIEVDKGNAVWDDRDTYTYG